jgi:hypothetical protein
MCCNTTVLPTDVYVRDEAANPNEKINAHALYVAGEMISSATTAPMGHFPHRGVAFQADFYSSASDALPTITRSGSAAMDRRV